MLENQKLIYAKDVAEMIGYTQQYFSTWRRGQSEDAKRFRNIVTMVGKRFNRRSVERYIEGAKF